MASSSSSAYAERAMNLKKRKLPAESEAGTAAETAAEIKILETLARAYAAIESDLRSKKIRQEMEQLKVERAERAREKRWLQTTRNMIPAESKMERSRRYYCSNEPTARYCYPLVGSLAELPEKWFEHEQGLYRIFEDKKECDTECRRVMDQEFPIVPALTALEHSFLDDEAIVRGAFLDPRIREKYADILPSLTLAHFYRAENYPFVIELLETGLLPPGDVSGVKGAISTLLMSMNEPSHEINDYDFQIAAILLKNHSSLILSTLSNFYFLSLLRRLAVKNPSRAYPLVSEVIEKRAFCDHHGVGDLISMTRNMDKKEDVKTLFNLLRAKCPERLKSSALNLGHILDYGITHICSHSPAHYLEEFFTDPKLLTAFDRARRDVKNIPEEECRKIIEDVSEGY